MICEDKVEAKEIIIHPRINGKLIYDISQADSLTVNKCQGLEFERVCVDVDSLFEYGSFYTAISRVKNLCNLFIIGNFDKVFETDGNNDFI